MNKPIPLPICPNCKDTKWVEDHEYPIKKCYFLAVTWICSKCNVKWSGQALDTRKAMIPLSC